MTLARLSVRRPVLMTMVVLVFAVLGGFSYVRLLVDLMPRIDLPVVTVTTVYPGASPEEVETQVTQKIEDAISNVSDIKHINSTSYENVSSVMVEFNDGVDVDVSAIDVKDEIDKIRRDLPDDVEDPTVAKFDINAEPVAYLAVSGARPLQELHQLADNQIRDEITKASGVAAIEIVGGREREIHVSVRRERLRAYGLSITDVLRAIAAENLNVPAGHITETWREYTVRTVGEFQGVADLARMQVRLKNGDRVALRELGDVLDAYQEARDLARYEGRNAVGLTVKKQGDANAVETFAGIRQAMSRLKEQLPADVSVSVAREMASFIEDSVEDVIQNILIGVLLTSLMLYLFTHSWRSTLIAAVAVPTSLVATFLLIDLAGFTVNVMTLMALSVSIGVLVTNALVVLENIIRHVEQGQEPEAAAEAGTGEIAVAVIAATATNVVVFTPIAFMSGIVGQIFRQFGLTVVFATLFSLFVSFTLIPMLAAKLLGHGHTRGRGGWRPLRAFGDAWDRGYTALTASYRGALGWCLRHGWHTAGATVAVLAFSVFLFGYVGAEFFPASDRNQVVVDFQMPPGTPLARTEAVLLKLEKVLGALPETETLYSTIGGENKGVEDGQVLVQLVDRADRTRGLEQLMNDLRPSLANIPGAEIRLLRPGLGRDQSAIVVEVTGPEMGRLMEISEQVRAAMLEMEELVDVQTSRRPARDELAFVPDRARMADLGIPTAAVAAVLRTSFEGEDASVFREHGEEHDIRLRLWEGDRLLLSEAERITIPSDVGDLPIDQLGKLEMRPGISEIKRKDKERLIEVTANLGHGASGDLVARIRAAVDQIDLPAGYHIRFGGDEERRVETFGEIIRALFLAIVLTYMVLAAIMESYVHPFTIMLTLPLGLIGVAFSLFLTANTLNVMSLMATVMLVGIVVNNAILILDYTQQLRGEGRDIREALVEAASVRLRPIVMSNVAIALSMVPQALGGTGAEFRVAMAVVTIGGVLLSAVFTLFVIPVVYVAMDRFARPPAQVDTAP